MVNTDRTIECKVRDSKDVLEAIIDLANENPLGETSVRGIVGGLKLDMDKEYLIITYTGREDIARRLETYIKMVNYDGSNEAVMATLRFKIRRQN